MENHPEIEIDWNALNALTVATPAPDDAGDTVKMLAMMQAPLNPPVEIEAPTAEISDAAKKLIEAEREIVHAFGGKHDDGKLFFAAGTKLWDIGLDTAQALAAEYAALPTIAAAADQHTATIASEDRAQREFVPSAWRIDATGRLTTRDAKVRATMSDTAWSQLCTLQSKLETPTDATPELRTAISSAKELPSGNVNGWIGLAHDSRKARVRTYRDERQVFALVSGSSRGYTICDGDDVLHKLARVLPDTRCETSYDARTTRLRARAYVQAPCDIPAFTSVGRVHKCGVQLTTRDDGMGSIEMRLFVERVRCKNHTLVSEAFGMVRRKHTGSYAKLVDQLHTLVGKMPEMIDSMRSLWARAATAYYLDSETGAQLDAPEAIARLVHAGHVPTGGMEPSEAIDAYVAAWRAEESPSSAAGVAMAIQRAAHETSWRTRWADDEIEESASALLYQPVYTLDAPAVEA